MDLERLKYRAHIIQKIRDFFSREKNYLELDTPALSPTLIPESCLEVFKTDYIAPFSGKKTPLYLVPSPEIYIKKIIAEHKINCFQLSKCYRNVESCGHIHNPEFTMLEYYSMHKDYKDSIVLTKELFNCITNKQKQQLPFFTISIDEAFKAYGGGAISQWFIDAKTMKDVIKKASEQVKRQGIKETKKNSFTNWSLEELYNLLLVQCVEPALPKGKFIILMDYPSFVPCLAKGAADGTIKDDTHPIYKTAERWELYCNGIELANCYTEETDKNKIKQYYKEESPIKKITSIVPHAIDEEYWKNFENFPPCSGVALGIDRLIAILSDSRSISPIMPFPL